MPIFDIAVAVIAGIVVGFPLVVLIIGTPRHSVLHVHHIHEIVHTVRHEIAEGVREVPRVVERKLLKG